MVSLALLTEQERLIMKTKLSLKQVRRVLFLNEMCSETDQSETSINERMFPRSTHQEASIELSFVYLEVHPH